MSVEEFGHSDHSDWKFRILFGHILSLNPDLKPDQGTSDRDTASTGCIRNGCFTSHWFSLSKLHHMFITPEKYFPPLIYKCWFLKPRLFFSLSVKMLLLFLLDMFSISAVSFASVDCTDFFFTKVISGPISFFFLSILSIILSTVFNSAVSATSVLLCRAGTSLKELHVSYEDKMVIWRIRTLAALWIQHKRFGFFCFYRRKLLFKKNPLFRAIIVYLVVS